MIQPEDFRLNSGQQPRPRLPSSPPPSFGVHGVSPLDAALRHLFETHSGNIYEAVEHALLRTAYQHCERNQLQTARLLGISRNVVRARLIQYGELSGSLRSSPPPGVPQELPPREHH